MLLVNAFRFIGQHSDLVFSKAGSQLLLSAAALGVAIGVSLPIGMITGHLRRGSQVAIGGANVLRALPTLAIIAVGIGLYGLGFVNIIVALAILGIPPILNNTYVGISSVPAATVDAGRGLGMHPWQVLLRLEIPNAVPLILGGIRTASVYIIATAYLGSFAGTDATLGTVITNEGDVRTRRRARGDDRDRRAGVRRRSAPRALSVPTHAWRAATQGESPIAGRRGVTASLCFSHPHPPWRNSCTRERFRNAWR